MLSINLLPEEARKGDQTNLLQFHRTPLMLIVGIGMVVSLFGLSVAVFVRHAQATKLSEQVQELQPKKLVVDQIQNFVNKLKNEQAAFDGLKRKDTAWAKRMSVLSEMVPDGVWFNSLMWDPVEGLRLEGQAIQEDGAEMGKLSRFLEALKTHASFGPELSEVKIDSVSRLQDQTIEMVKFTITGKIGQAKL